MPQPFIELMGSTARRGASVDLSAGGRTAILREAPRGRPDQRGASMAEGLRSHQHPPVDGGRDDLHLRLVGRLRHRGHGAVLGPWPDAAHAGAAARVLGAAHGAGLLGARLGAAATKVATTPGHGARWASSGASSAAGGRGPANGSTRPCTSRWCRATSAPGGRSSTAGSSGLSAPALSRSSPTSTSAASTSSPSARCCSLS